MWIHYPDRVEESEDLLLNQERRLRCSPLADRVKMLRLLKSGRYRSQAQLAPVLGHSDRTLRRWWQCYQLILPRFGGHEDKVVLSSSTYGRF